MNCPKCGKKTKIMCGIRFSTIEVLCEILPAQFPPENRYRKPKPKTKPKKPKAKPNNDWLERINRKLEEV